MAPSKDGERTERLTNTLFGAKDGGHHHRKRTSTLTSLRRTKRRAEASRKAGSFHSCCANTRAIERLYLQDTPWFHPDGDIGVTRIRARDIGLVV